MEGGFVDVQICKCADIGRKSKETVQLVPPEWKHQNGRKLVNTLSYNAETCIPTFGIPLPAY
jgi:hypothetical protein